MIFVSANIIAKTGKKVLSTTKTIADKKLWFKAYYLKNKEKYVERNNKHKEENRDYNKNYYQKNKDKIDEKSRKYYS